MQRNKRLKCLPTFLSSLAKRSARYTLNPSFSSASTNRSATNSKLREHSAYVFAAWRNRRASKNASAWRDFMMSVCFGVYGRTIISWKFRSMHTGGAYLCVFERGLKIALLQSGAPNIAILLVRHNLIERLRGMGPIRMIDRIRRDPDHFLALLLFSPE